MKQVIPVLLIGAMKSGTSTLYHLLSQHPQICAGKHKEPEYFSNPINQSNTYLNLFTIEEHHKYIIDASTGYTKFPEVKHVAKRIKDYQLDPYFIYIVRNPFDRIESHYNFMKDYPSWNYTIDDDYLISISNYYVQLNQYTIHFPKEKILILDFDDLITQPQAICNQVFTFIDAQPCFLPINHTIQKNKTLPFSGQRQYIAHKFNQWNISLHPIIKQGLKQILPYLSRQSFTSLTQSQRDCIHKQLQPDMISFAKEYKFDISKWNFNF